jgi:Sulfotransferase family
VPLWLRGIRRGETCGCGQPFHECPFWTAIGDRAFGGWSQVDIDALMTLHDRVDRLRHMPSVVARPGAPVRRYADAYRSIYQAAHELTGAHLVVDSSKHPSLACCLRAHEQLDLRVLHVVRDPRAVAYSWSRTVERPEATGDEPLMSRYAPSRAAALWTVENAALTALGRLGVPLLRIRYEQLVSDPRGTVRRVLGFAGMAGDFTLPITGHRATLSPSHTVSGNPMRLLNGPLEIRLDDEWRTQFRTRDRWVVGAMTAPLRVAYGVGNPWSS